MLLQLSQSYLHEAGAPEHDGDSSTSYREVLKYSLQSTLRDFEIPVEAEDGYDFGTAMEGWEPFPESAAVLGTLKESFSLAVISNGQRDIIPPALEKLKSPFEYVVTG